MAGMRARAKMWSEVCSREGVGVDHYDPHEVGPYEFTPSPSHLLLPPLPPRGLPHHHYHPPPDMPHPPALACVPPEIPTPSNSDPPRGKVPLHMILATQV
eukprot:746551-Hanusia_phi.AAC.10